MRTLGLAIFMIMSSPAVAEEFGRLFTTSEERRALNSQKLSQRDGEGSEVAAPPPIVLPDVSAVPNELRYSGYIQRADGVYAIWINGQSVLSRQDLPISEAQFLQEEQALLKFGRQQAVMKPGQIWSLDANTVREGYHLKRTSDPVLPGSE